MNFQANMIPGICALAVGALLTFFGGRLCHREKDVPQVKLLGVALGAVMYYLVIQVVLWLGLNTDDLKLLTALVVGVFLSVPYIKGRYFTKTRGKAAK